MDGEHQKTENMDAGPGNRTYDMTSNLTKLGGMGAGPTSVAGVFIDAVWEGTSQYQVGKDTRWLAIAILAGSAGTSLESNPIEKIKSTMECNTNPKTMGHIMGYVGTLEQRASFRQTGTTTNHTLCSQQSDSQSIRRQSPTATKRCLAPASQPNCNNT